ncbi:MAG: Jag N-terminal domain-containing protein [Spirochaetaceae bacterium]|jgi:spoIIIJ-associated protein|nr:Jag N-terminal domain-containing protein [Spirochaetaceae bacterium]
MKYDFTGKTEREAIELAAAELGLEQDRFDVEILETQKTTLFKKGYVKIRVHTDGSEDAALPETGKPTDRVTAQSAGRRDEGRRESGGRESRDARSETRIVADPMPQNEFEQKLVEFITTVIQKMGYEAGAEIMLREEAKLIIKLSSPSSSILIGRKGKNLDALQMVLNVYADHLGRGDLRIVLDAENYRIHHEESLVRLAYNTADKVRQRGGSILLESMNPFERRLIHTALNDIRDVETKSEGEGLYKQVRVIYKGGYENNRRSRNPS